MTLPATNCEEQRAPCALRILTSLSCGVLGLYWFEPRGRDTAEQGGGAQATQEQERRTRGQVLSSGAPPPPHDHSALTGSQDPSSNRVCHTLRTSTVWSTPGTVPDVFRVLLHSVLPRALGAGYCYQPVAQRRTLTHVPLSHSPEVLSAQEGGGFRLSVRALSWEQVFRAAVSVGRGGCWGEHFYVGMWVGAGRPPSCWVASYGHHPQRASVSLSCWGCQ